MKLQPRPLTSSLGSKYVMAVTGLLLIGFVLVHMAGNLLVFAGPDALNNYAHGLKARPPLLWGARLGLLAVFVTHLAYAIRLRLQNAKARPIGYAYPDTTLQASWASRHMMLTGLVLLSFVVYHLAHYTLGVVTPAKYQHIGASQKIEELPKEKDYLELTERRLSDGTWVADPELNLGKAEEASHKASPGERTEVRADVYSMVINGFRHPIHTALYVLAMVFLALHLWHGGSSWLQSLGIAPPGYKRLLAGIGPALALVVFVGNCSMPLYVLVRYGAAF